MARGGAKLGDKTLLDALIPVHEKLKEHATSGGALGTALCDAAGEADKAVDETRSLVAHRGRASQRARRAGGHRPIRGPNDAFASLADDTTVHDGG